MFMANKGHEGDVAKTAGEKYQLCLCASPPRAQAGGWRVGKREAQSVK